MLILSTPDVMNTEAKLKVLLSKSNVQIVVARSRHKPFKTKDVPLTKGLLVWHMLLKMMDSQTEL